MRRKRVRRCAGWRHRAGRPSCASAVSRFRRVTPEGQGFELGKAVTLREGNDITLIAIGTLVSRALQAAELLAAQGVHARVINMASVKPLDNETVLRAARETRAIVTAEEAIVTGGLGGAVAELVSQHHPVPMRILGVPDLAPTGSAEFLLEHFGLTAQGIAREALALRARFLAT